MDELTTFVYIGDNEHDDAADGVTQLAITLAGKRFAEVKATKNFMWGRRQSCLLYTSYKDADYFLIKLFNKIHNETSIVRFNRKTFILETETCTAVSYTHLTYHAPTPLKNGKKNVL